MAFFFFIMCYMASSVLVKMHFGNQFYFGVLRADFGMQGLVDEDH